MSMSAVMRISCFCLCTDVSANAICPPFRHGMQEKKEMECLNVIKHLHIGCEKANHSECFCSVQCNNTHSRQGCTQCSRSQSTSKHTSARFKRVLTFNPTASMHAVASTGVQRRKVPSVQRRSVACRDWPCSVCQKLILAKALLPFLWPSLLSRGPDD